MKRRLATILVLTLLISAIGGIAIFSSAEANYTADPIRMLLYDSNKYQYNLTTGSTADAYDYVNGIKQEIPFMTVAADGSLTITGESGTVYSSADMNGLITVLKEGDYHRTSNKGMNIPGTAAQPAGSRYFGFKVNAALTAAVGDTAAITNGIKAFLTAYKTSGGQLDGVMTDKADAATLNEVVFSAVKEVYPDITMVAYDVAAGNVWQQTGSSNTIAAGNTSSIRWEATVPGYTVNDYQKFLGAILRLRDAAAATNGNVQFAVSRADVGNNKQYYYDGIAHAVLMGADILYESTVSGSYQHGAAKTVQFANSLVGFSDRQPLNIANSKNDLFVISGMYAAGRNVYYVTVMDKEKAAVAETEEGVIIDMGSQTLTFAGGKLISTKRQGDAAGNVYTIGYWIETEAEVEPVVVNQEDRLMTYREDLVYHYTFNGAEAGFWKAEKVGDGYYEAMMQDDSLLLMETTGIRYHALITYKMGGLTNVQGKVFGASVEFTLPAAGMPTGARLDLLAAMTAGGCMDSGITLMDGVLYAKSTSIPMEMNAEIENGKTYTAKCVYDFTMSGSPLGDYYVYDAEGNLVASAEGIALTTYHENNLYAFALRVKDQGMDPIIAENFKLYWVQDEVFDLSVFDVATGTKVDAAAAHESAVAYRLDWMNICVAGKTQSLVAGHYDEEGNLVSEEVLATMNMVPGADGFASGVVEPKADSICIYVKQSNAWTSNLTCKDITYGEILEPKAEAAMGNVTYVYATAADGEYTADVPVNAGTYYVKAIVAGTDEYATLESAPVEVTIAKAALTITAANTTVTYGDALPKIDVVGTGFVADDDESVLNGTLAVDTDYVQFANVGTYALTPKGLTSDNYEITFAAGTLTVAAKEIGIQWGNLMLEATGEAQAPTATATGAVNGDVLTLTVEGAQTEAGKDYVATVTGITGDKAANYKLPADVDTTFSIGQDFALDVVGGTYDADAKVGDTVTVKAEEAPAGKEFAGWEITGIDTTDMDLTSETISFVITKGSSITVKALYKAQVFTVTVDGVEQKYEVGATVTVKAGTKEGFDFAGWTVEGVAVEDTSVKTITFVMPAGNVTLTANWNPKTGDTFPVAAVAALAIFSVMGMAVISFRKKAI